MTQPRSTKQPILGKHFWAMWILGNTLAHGAGLGLPILAADVVSAYDYIAYGTTAFITFGVWVGLAQWLVLRRQMLISPRWIFNVAITPVISILFPLLLLPQSPYALLLLFITYPITNALLQWQLLRQCFQPAKRWILIGAIATLLGSAIALTFSVIATDALLFLPLGMIALLSGQIR